MTRTQRRRSRRSRRCESCLSVIHRHEVYVEHVMSPWHGDVGTNDWQRVAECADCATRYGRGPLLEVVAR